MAVFLPLLKTKRYQTKLDDSVHRPLWKDNSVQAYDYIAKPDNRIIFSNAMSLL